MRVSIVAPVKTVNITLIDVTYDDLTALIGVLDKDRNHPASSVLYDELRAARRIFPQPK